EDNIFPHHECERAQSCACTGNDRFARHWFHGRFLQVEGEKMSKSKGNFFTARDLFDKGHEPAAVRLELIKTHYRANANFTEQGLKDSARRIARYRRYAKRVFHRLSKPDDDADLDVLGSLVKECEAFAEAMNNDMNIALALSVLDTAALTSDEPSGIFDLYENQRERLAAFDSRADKPLPEHPMELTEASRLLVQRDKGDEVNLRAQREWAALHAIDSVLGVIFVPNETTSITTDFGVYIGIAPSPEVESLLAERRDAKKAKDFARADAIRDQLATQGLAIKDVPGGKVEVSKV
ncbi:Cysteinyl-tRNA synthetase, partial [hydrothermal vent metagenome]